MASSDVALRKAKNASAQAAFRARRANYISTLEETVTNLESVVVQLQDSCRDAKSEAQELRQDNARLRQAFRDRENLWRAMWPRKGDGDEPQIPPPPSFLQPPPVNGHVSQYAGDSLNYRVGDDPVLCGPQFTTQNATYVENDVPTDARVQKYPTYFNPITASPRDSPWPQTPAGPDGSVAQNGSHSNSPHFVESPTVTSPVMTYGRYEDQKVPMNTLDSAYVFPHSRSISPSTSTPPTSSFALTSPFQSNFADHERPDFDYRRQSGEVILHGGTADISLAAPSSDAVRYRLHRRPDSSGVIPVLPPLAASDNSTSPQEGGSDGDSSIYPSHRLRSRRGTLSRNSRSPTPDMAPPLSGTLAVIKAQAFGALRRTRARAKKPEGAGKVAVDVLEARGLGMSGSRPAKRQRMSDDQES
ncbi:hypothetical protein CPB85DRAFT_57422 [Mucidula mucida]|nr:hypothetical protein CPB85DRAFT_57422 [Mucidula mucida]